MGTKEYPSSYPNPNAAHSPTSPSAAWSASGQLNFPSSNGSAGGKDSQFFGTRPLGTLPGATKRPSASLNQTLMGGPSLAGGGASAANQNVQTPTYDYGRGPSAAYPAAPPAATAVYDRSTLAGPGPSPAAAYAQSPAGSYAGVTKTSMFAMPPAATTGTGTGTAAWQPALPVSPWSTHERSAVVLGGSVETETILRSDLKALKRSRLKAWMYFMLLLGATGGMGYLGFKNQRRLSNEIAARKTEIVNMQQEHQKTLANLGVSEGARAAAAKRAPIPGAVAPAGVMPTGTPAAAATVASPRTAKLTEDLKKQLAGVPGLTIESRADRVVVMLDQGALFAPNEYEVGVTGYRVLYRFGKAIKTVKDRHIMVSVPSVVSRRGKSWNVAAARAVSLGRFLIDDLSVEPHRVIARAPAPGGGRGRVERIEFSLEAAPETSKS